jgi:hypothetical protein
VGEEPDAIRADIEETRARMGERAEALAYKADVPARSREKVHDVTERIKEKVTGMTHSVSSSTSSASGSVSDKAHGVAGSVSDKSHAAGQRLGDSAHRAKGLAESNPLGLAIGAVAAGFIAGLLVPVTRFENEHLGQAADTLREKAQEVGQEATDRARSAVQAAEGAVKEEVTSSSS